jgi:hypothetical protein
MIICSRGQHVKSVTSADTYGLRSQIAAKNPVGVWSGGLDVR